MKVAYDKTTGLYVDNEDSHPQGYYVGNLRGAREEDIVVLDVPREDEPWNKKLVDGKLVDDGEKIARLMAAHDHELAEKNRRAATIAKLKAKLGLDDDEMALLGLE